MITEVTHVVVYKSVAPRILLVTKMDFEKNAKINIKAGQPIIYTDLFNGSEDECYQFIKKANLKL